MYAERVAAPLLHLSYASTYQTRDRGLLEFVGPQGVATELSRASAGGQLPLGFLFRRLVLTLVALTSLLRAVGHWGTLLPGVDRPGLRVRRAAGITLLRP